ncbi:hypothetical protein [Novosphingobium clariflavum]|uniref:DUF883 domain-containing protein n=1 Tax=Novosphingobium clariflavum TaxID=2029884 RepID=A0ABV6S9J6_9SPHN|nr:hypothetical protein [Novosphingobium clariflavum]
MADPTTDTGNGTENAKSHFTKAMEEVRAGAAALGKEAQSAAEGYLGKLNEAKTEWSSEAKARSEDAKVKASAFAEDAKVKASAFADDAKVKAVDLANQGKARTSQAMISLSKVIDDNVGLIDDKVGPKYGDYARSAAKSVSGAATKLDEKSLDELGDEAREFVRKSPGVAIGAAIAAGFLLGRLFKKSN